MGTATAAGRLMVARASLVHQINDAATATTTAIVAAAAISVLVRRSGLTMRWAGQLARAAKPSWACVGRRRRRRRRRAASPLPDREPDTTSDPESDAVPEPGSGWRRRPRLGC